MYRRAGVTVEDPRGQGVHMMNLTGIQVDVTVNGARVKVAMRLISTVWSFFL
jgi:hypothetical protein